MTGKSGLQAIIGFLKCTIEEEVRLWVLRFIKEMLYCLAQDKVDTHLARVQRTRSNLLIFPLIV